MLAQPITKSLHLPSLTIEGFRGIKSLSIPRLGRVTLLSGMNGVGKSTVLEAVQLYATRGHPGVIGNVLRERDELISIIDDDGEEVSAPDVESLFYGRLPSSDSRVSIGVPDSEERRLSIGLASSPKENQRNGFDAGYSDDTQEGALQIEFQGGMVREFPLDSLLRPRLLRRAGITKSGNGNSSVITCETFGAGVIDNDDIARLWSNVALTSEEERAVDALRLVYGDRVSGVSVVDEARTRYIRRPERRPIVKIKGHDRPVPLRSLGDGATRIFGVALALANSQGGFLVIDEAENGIHHSVQQAFWNMVIRTAQENDVQVIATTHSWDCVVGFGLALTDIALTNDEDEAGHVVHLSRYGDGIRATEYSGENLQTAIRHGTEMR